MWIEYDREADALYVYFSDNAVWHTTIVDDARYVHYDQEGCVRGVELLAVADGVHIADLPVDTAALRDILYTQGVEVLDEAG